MVVRQNRDRTYKNQASPKSTCNHSQLPGNEKQSAPKSLAQKTLYCLLRLPSQHAHAQNRTAQPIHHLPGEMAVSNTAIWSVFFAKEATTPAKNT